MKKLASLKGVKTLSKSQQKSIHGGSAVCDPCAGQANHSQCYVMCDKRCPGQCYNGQCAHL